MITPVLLCGGSGTRLWPLSRKSFPKQFTPILGEQSLFQAAATRFDAEGFDAPLIVTGDDFRFIVAQQMAETGRKPAAIMIEPDGRNTAPAALAAALFLTARDPEALMLLVPSDHAISDPAAFREVVLRGAPAAQEGRIVLFGIAPTRPETGYGWLEMGGQTPDGVHALERFIEKPDAPRAAELFADPRYLWNAGVFLASAGTLVQAFRLHAPDLLKSVAQAMKGAHADLDFLRLDREAWGQVADISIDYAIMEKARNLSVVRFDAGWSDLGSWDAVWQESARDAAGNAFSGQAIALDCEGSLLRSESDEIAVVGIGLRNITAIAMRDAVLVADMSRAQEVKEAVAILKKRRAKQAAQFPKDHRPWGWFETLVLADRFQVKRIHVRPGASLSLQSHVHRSEHWIVVAGTARVTVDDRVQLLAENQSVYIPLGAVHRMENPGKVPMVLIEVQTGSYLGEDDIIRYEDIYARPERG